MRGADHRSERLFSYVRPDSRVPADHPLRAIRRITDTALASLSAQFETLYSEVGRPSIPPEKLLRALLLQAFFSVRSERQLMEQLDYNLLFRWFVGLSVDEPVWVPTVNQQTPMIIISCTPKCTKTVTGTTVHALDISLDKAVINGFAETGDIALGAAIAD